MRLLIVVAGIFFLGCSSDSGVANSEGDYIFFGDKNSNVNLLNDSVEKINNKPQRENKNPTIHRDFLDCYNNLVIAIGTHNDSLFNTIIHKDYSLCFIETTGALPSIRSFFQIQKFKTIRGNKSINQLLYHQMEEPIFEPLPKIICDEKIFDKQGCFAQEINPLLESQIWNHLGLENKEIRAIESLVKTVNFTVINTSNFIFYFSNIEEKWYLTFIDTRIPCSA